MKAWTKRRCFNLLSVLFGTVVSVTCVAQTKPLVGHERLEDIIENAHYDQVAVEFSGIAQEAIYQALALGFYIPIEQRKALLSRIRQQFDPDVMSAQFLRHLKLRASSGNLLKITDWYAGESGRAVVNALARANQPGASKRQNAIAAALEADADLLSWWQSFESQFNFAEHWLQLREQVIFDGAIHIASLLKPYTPFDRQKFEQHLDVETFEMRPNIDRQWRLRFLDSVRSLVVTDRIRFQEFSTSAAHIRFLGFVSEANREVYVEAATELKILLTEMLSPKQPEPQKPAEPEL